MPSVNQIGSQRSSAAPIAERQLRDVHAGDQKLRNDADRGQVNRADERDAGQHAVDVVRRPLARADAGDEAAVLAHVVGRVDRIEDDRRVEVGEEDDAHDLQQVVERLAHLQLIADRCRPRRLIIVAMVCGMTRIDDAKMTGMTPAVLTRSGR